VENVKYLLVKDKKEESLETDLKKISGFVFNPQNNIKYDGILVDEVKLAKPEFVEKILKEYRNSIGKFSSIEEIKNVSGIGDKTFEKFKDTICV
jgi:hypothetical protein